MSTILGVIGLAFVAFGWMHPDIKTGMTISATLGVAAWIAGVCIGLSAAVEDDPS